MDSEEGRQKLDHLSSQVGAVLIELARLTANVEATRNDLSRNATDTAHDLTDHELRIRELESHRTKEHAPQIAALLQWRARVIGYMAGAAAGGGLAGAGIVEAAIRLSTHSG